MAAGLHPAKGAGKLTASVSPFQTPFFPKIGLQGKFLKKHRRPVERAHQPHAGKDHGKRKAENNAVGIDNQRIAKGLPKQRGFKQPQKIAKADEGDVFFEAVIGKGQRRPSKGGALENKKTDFTFYRAIQIYSKIPKLPFRTA